MESSNWIFEWIFEWRQLTGGYNWYTFHPIMIEFEDERNVGGAEATIIILGVGFRVRWNYMETKATREMVEQVSNIFGDNP